MGTEVIHGASSVVCSICLDEVLNKGERSRAILQCGHEFHLDCIGSMFNSKDGVMQCPNCRKTEKGQWLFATGSHSSYSESNLVDWPHDDLYDVAYSEMPVGAHWCPFSGLHPMSPSFEDRDSTATPFQIRGNDILAENTAASSVAGPGPYVSIFQPFVSSSPTNSNEHGNASGFNHLWSAMSRPNDISTIRHTVGTTEGSAPFSATIGHSVGPTEAGPAPFSATIRHRTVGTIIEGPATEAIRSIRGDPAGPPRSGSAMQPIFLDHGSVARAGIPVPPTVPPSAGVNSRAHDRVEGVRAQQQQVHPHMPVSTSRRSRGPRGVSPVGPQLSSNRGSNFYRQPTSGSSGRIIQEAGSQAPSHFYAVERDRSPPCPFVTVDRELSWWQQPPSHTYHLAASGNSSDSGTRANSYGHRNGTERTSSQGRLHHPPPPG